MQAASAPLLCRVKRVFVLQDQHDHALRPPAGGWGQLGPGLLSQTTRCCRTETEVRTPPSSGKWQTCSYGTPNSWRRGHRGRWPSPRSLARQLTSGAHPIGGERAVTPPPTRCCRRLPQPHTPSPQRRFRLLHCLASSKQTQRHGALLCHTPQRAIFRCSAQLRVIHRYGVRVY